MTKTNPNKDQTPVYHNCGLADVPYIEITNQVSIELSDKNIKDWSHFTNKTYFGTETIPLSVDSSKIPQHLKDVHWHIHSGKRVSVSLRLYANGSIVVLPKQTIMDTNIPIPAKASRALKRAKEAGKKDIK